MLGSTNLKTLTSITRAVLCAPFEWCRVQGGPVRLEDASRDGGTKGGRYQIGSFAISKYLVTNAQYQRFLDDPNGFPNPDWWEFSPQAIHWREDHRKSKPTAFEGANLPRTRISWFDSMAFCAWLSACVEFLDPKQGDAQMDMQRVETWSVHLPTEQEWQRAALGGKDWKYPWGNNLEDKCSNYGNTVGHPTPVDGYPNGQSPCKAMDMVGNVWEWCLTTWGIDGIDPGGYTYRLLKGGAWNVSNPEHLRARERYGHSPRGRLNDAGFRCVYCH